MKKFFVLLVLVFLAALVAVAMTSCKTSVPTPPPAIVVTPAPTLAELKARILEVNRASKAAAATRAARIANQDAPQELPAVQLTDGELTVAIANQDTPKPEDMANALARVVEGKNGDLVSAKAKQTQAAKDADALRKELSEAQAKADEERKAAAELLSKREGEWRAKFTTLEKTANEAKDELAAEKRNTAKKVQFWFALILRLMAAGLLLVAGLKAKAAIATGLGGMEAVKGTMATVALSAAAFTLSWAVAQWWFYYACAGFAVLVFGLWAAHAYFADKAKGTLNKIGEAIDAGKVVDSQGQAVSSTVDLAALGRAMNEPEKKLVSKLRNVRRVAKAKAAT